MLNLKIEATTHGILCGHRLLGYSVVIRHLDTGRYDGDLLTGMQIIAGIWEAEEKGCYPFTDEQRMIVWRWVVAALFITEQRKQNGTVEVDQGDGTIATAVRYVGEHGGIVVYPATERFSLANNVESVAFEKYTHDRPQLKAAQMYQQMVSVENGLMCLSAWGREGLALLHDSFIEMLNTEGMPAAPVAH